MKRLPINPAGSPFRRHPRRGSWLAQMVVTMTVMSALLTIVSTALFRLYRQEATMVEQVWQSTVWQRLNRDFRADLHQATSAALSEDQTEIQLQHAESRISWKLEDDEIRRVRQTTDQPVDLSTQTGEQYRFPDASIGFALTTEKGHLSIASIEFTPAALPGGQSRKRSRIVATVGIDHRFASSSAEVSR